MTGVVGTLSERFQRECELRDVAAADRAAMLLEWMKTRLTHRFEKTARCDGFDIRIENGRVNSE
jgi:hypothetical protein